MAGSSEWKDEHGHGLSRVDGAFDRFGASSRRDDWRSYQNQQISAKPRRMSGMRNLTALRWTLRISALHVLETGVFD